MRKNRGKLAIYSIGLVYLLVSTQIYGADVKTTSVSGLEKLGDFFKGVFTEAYEYLEDLKQQLSPRVETISITTVGDIMMHIEQIDAEIGRAHV